MSKNKTKKPCMADLARACGVSPMTVSRALRRDAAVSEETRIKVRRTAERIGYHVNYRMGRPRSRPARDKRPVVEVVFGTAVAPLNMFQTRLLFMIEQALAQRNFDCLVRTCGVAYGDFVGLCESLRESPAAATLITGAFDNPRLETMLGIVRRALLVDFAGVPRLRQSFEYIGFDNLEAARMVTRHLISLGRRRILLLRGVPDHDFSREMEQGYREVLEEAGMAFDPALVRAADFTVEGAYACLRDALGTGGAFDAVFTNDEMAMGVLRALHEARRRVPEDVAVAGCDGLPLGLYTIPRLTTVRLDLPMMARLAVERLAERLDGAPPACRIRLLPCLEIRESTVGSAAAGNQNGGK